MEQSQVSQRYRLLDSLLEGCQVIDAEWRYVYVNDAVARHGRRAKADMLGRTMMEVFPGIEHTPMFETLRRAMAQRTSDQLENEFAYADGSTGWFELRVEPVPEGLFILSLETTARKRAEQQMQRQLRRLGALRAIDLAILGTTDLRLTMKAVLHETTRQLAVDASAVFLLRPGAATLEVVEATGLRTAGLRVRVGDGAVGQSALDRRTMVVPDLSDAAADTGQVPAQWQHDGVLGLCAVPLVAKGHVIGVLVVAHREPLRFDDEWFSFLEALAGQAAMALESGKAFEDLQRSHLDLVMAYESTIEGWASALDLRDHASGTHTVRVADLTVDLAREAGMSPSQLVHVRHGALLHDIGKMGIPDAILNKGSSLTSDEWVIMQKHPTYAYELLWPIPYLRQAVDIPYCHHERWDGCGYPRGLKGAAIPLAARLFAVVDVWDALRSDRPYRVAWSDAKALTHLRAVSGTHLDPEAVDLFIAIQSRT